MKCKSSETELHLSDSGSFTAELKKHAAATGNENGRPRCRQWASRNTRTITGIRFGRIGFDETSGRQNPLVGSYDWLGMKSSHLHS